MRSENIEKEGLLCQKRKKKVVGKEKSLKNEEKLLEKINLSITCQIHPNLTHINLKCNQRDHDKK